MTEDREVMEFLPRGKDGVQGKAEDSKELSGNVRGSGGGLYSCSDPSDKTEDFQR